MNNVSGRLVIYLVGAACIFVILFGIRASASIINPILLALVITVTVLPVPSRLTRQGMPGWLALMLTIGIVVFILGVVISTVFFSVTKLSTQVPAYLASASKQTVPAIASATSPDDAGLSEQISMQITPAVGGILENVANLLGEFGFALVIFFFMISAAIALPTPSRLGMDPSAPIVGRVAALTEDVRKYMTMLTGVNLLVGLGNSALLWFMGVDFAILWGVLAWFMGYIPSIGFLIALIPPVLLAYAQYGLESALIVLIGYILINGGVQNFIQPKIMGQQLKISPVVIFVGLFIWGYLLGGIGAILAVPMTMLVLIIMENFEGTRPLAILMRYTGEEKEKGEKQAALKHVQGLWRKAKETFSSDHDPDGELRDVVK